MTHSSPLSPLLHITTCRVSLDPSQMAQLLSINESFYASPQHPSSVQLIQLFPVAQLSCLNISVLYQENRHINILQNADFPGGVSIRVHLPLMQRSLVRSLLWEGFHAVGAMSPQATTAEACMLQGLRATANSASKATTEAHDLEPVLQQEKPR